MKKLKAATNKKNKQDYAPYMYIGEERRDSSDNIKGYLYQDILAVDMILKSNSEDKIYLEWCEDIFIENDDSIYIYQVKYYPKTKIDNSKKAEVCKNLFYEYLKYKLYEEKSNKKDIDCFLLYFSTNMPIDMKNININSLFSSNNQLDETKKKKIKTELEKCGEMKKRQNLIFKEVASNELAESFNYELIPKRNIVQEKDNLKEALYREFIRDNKDNKDNLFPNYKEDQIKDILFAISIQYVQSSYYNKPKKENQEDYRQRGLSKNSLDKHVDKVIGPDKEKENDRIAYTILSYIDEAFIEDWLNYIDDDDNETIKIYTDIYHSTKEFFKLNMQDKKERCRFINSLNDKPKIFDINSNFSVEQKKIQELKPYIKTSIQIIWKIMYDYNFKNFDNLINKEGECYTIKFPSDNAKKSLIIPVMGGKLTSEANRCLERVYMMKNKPDKWYCPGLGGGLYEYSFEINEVKDIHKAKIDNCKINKIKNENEIEIFYVKCLKCVDFDECGISKKDEVKYLFKSECKEGGNNAD